MSWDFETGASLAALGFTNIVDLSTQSGAGLGSTWGVRGDAAASASAKAFAKARVPVTHSGRDFTLYADFDHCDWLTGYSDGTGNAFEMAAPGSGVFLTLGHGFDGSFDYPAHSLVLFLQAQGGNVDVWRSAANVIVPNTTQRILLCGQLSSAPLVADGSVTVKIDGVTLTTLTNVAIYGNGITNPPVWTELRINPSGRLDNLTVLTTGCISASATPPRTPTIGISVVSCCGHDGAASDVPPHDIDQPPLTYACIGGGLYLTAADPIFAETWTLA